MDFGWRKEVEIDKEDDPIFYINFIITARII